MKNNDPSDAYPLWRKGPVDDSGRVDPVREVFTPFRTYHELMGLKIREILLVSSPYDAFLLEEDVSLASRIIHEYSGLNLSQPPRVTRVSSPREAIRMLSQKAFDMAITMPHLDESDPFAFGLDMKRVRPNMPVILLAHSLKGIYPVQEGCDRSGIDRIFLWSGSSDLLLALIKNAEDRLNIDQDTRKAKVRVLLLVEDSPAYYSLFLPLIYREVVRQTQAVLEGGLNEEHRLLTMRARPKILLAVNFEEAMEYYEKFRPYLFGIISDARFPMKNRMEDHAGYLLLKQVHREIPDLPLLLMSANPSNRNKAEEIPAVFLDKNSLKLHSEIRDFFLRYLGFGDFVFRMPDGREVGRASTLRELQEKVAVMPEESLWYHAKRNHFSNWIMARAEIALASLFREVQASWFSGTEELREYIISSIRASRKWHQRGVVAQFHPGSYDPEINDFVKIGQGSIGGKARSLAFMADLLGKDPSIHKNYQGVDIEIPKTLVITTDGFESFTGQNRLHHFAVDDSPDHVIAEAFLKAEMPGWISRELASYLSMIRYPLSVRSSSLLEDAQFQPYAGLYETFMIPNNHPDPAVRLEELVAAVKLVYASTYYQGPKAFSRSVSLQPQEEKMAVVIQQLAGENYGDYFYPAVSGVAQSYNYYPIPPMKREEGIAHIALGLGKTVMEGERTLRFSPRYPGKLHQFSSVDDILRNAQRFFYALKIRNSHAQPGFQLTRREVDEAESEFPVKTLAGTYVIEEHRIRDTGHMPGGKVLTFAPILKYDLFPLSPLLCDLLEKGRMGMGAPVEIEFSVNPGTAENPKKEFFFLQMRPMAAGHGLFEVKIEPHEIQKSFCYSTQALGNGRNDRIADIVYVRKSEFRADATVQIAHEIGLLNAHLVKENRPYLLVGPGRWGSADRWLGIPVQWTDISGVGAMIELRDEQLKAEPSQGTHFFQNITSLGIHYITVTEGSRDFFRWEWVDSLPAFKETRFLRQVRLEKGMTIKIDGRTSEGIILE
ncbi:MAG: phosphoenolpyruvate synthase/pyruvate phosphate dikinase [Deltaproteobacteria bacterium HGW-Deltaproteobacteria-21]|nr:MAG: phosphoenolpyruvate synthase/pyruvate phosphate dikinase [Deltaproteobacteria bacterium HGW-Deltaproteobacteria-21]